MFEACNSHISHDLKSGPGPENWIRQGRRPGASWCGLPPSSPPPAPFPIPSPSSSLLALQMHFKLAAPSLLALVWVLIFQEYCRGCLARCTSAPRVFAFASASTVCPAAAGGYCAEERLWKRTFDFFWQALSRPFDRSALALVV